MVFRDRHTFVYAPNNLSFFTTKTFYKSKDIASTVQAQFRYILFNHHCCRFVVKQSLESRLFNPTSLTNLDEVQNDFKESLNSCVKLPQVCYVVFYNGSPSSERECFERLKKGLVELL